MTTRMYSIHCSNHLRFPTPLLSSFLLLLLLLPLYHYQSDSESLSESVRLTLLVMVSVVVVLFLVFIPPLSPPLILLQCKWGSDFCLGLTLRSWVADSAAPDLSRLPLSRVPLSRLPPTPLHTALTAGYDKLKRPRSALSTLPPPPFSFSVRDWGGMITMLMLSSADQHWY